MQNNMKRNHTHDEFAPVYCTPLSVSAVRLTLPAQLLSQAVDLSDRCPGHTLLPHISCFFAVMQKPLSQAIGFVAVLWGQPSQTDKDALGCPVLSYAEVADKGRQNLTGFEANPIKISGSDLATLVYTSGTTGNPKVLPCLLLGLILEQGGRGAGGGGGGGGGDMSKHALVATYQVMNKSYMPSYNMCKRYMPSTALK